MKLFGRKIRTTVNKSLGSVDMADMSDVSTVQLCEIDTTDGLFDITIRREPSEPTTLGISEQGATTENLIAELLRMREEVIAGTNKLVQYPVEVLTNISIREYSNMGKWIEENSTGIRGIMILINPIINPDTEKMELDILKTSANELRDKSGVITIVINNKDKAIQVFSKTEIKSLLPASNRGESSPVITTVQPEPVAEPVAGPVAEPAAEPTVEPATGQSIEEPQTDLGEFAVPEVLNQEEAVHEIAQEPAQETVQEDATPATYIIRDQNGNDKDIAGFSQEGYVYTEISTGKNYQYLNHEGNIIFVTEM